MSKLFSIVMLGDASAEHEAVIRAEISSVTPNYELVKCKSLAEFSADFFNVDSNPVSLFLFDMLCAEADSKWSAIRRELRRELVEKNKPFFQSIAFNVPKEQGFAAFKFGAHFAIEEDADNADWRSIIHGAMKASKINKQLTAEVKEASDIALLSMAISSYLGEVIKFLELSFACKTHEDLFETLHHCISRMSLSCCAVMEVGNNLIYFTNEENHNELEFALAHRKTSRIWDHNTISLFSFPCLSVLVYPMPVNDIDRYGQLKDVLVMLVNGANARVHGISVEMKALQAHEIKTAFLARMSHELRTPLNAIIGFSRVLQKRKSGDLYGERDTDAISAINVNGHHLLNMVSDLLDFAQADVGGLTLEKSHCDIVALVSKVIEGFRFWADEKKIELFPVADENGLIALVDPARIEQIVRNIVSNAIKYTDQGSIIPSVRKCVDARLGECFSVGIKDSGIGISDEQYKQLVQMFTQPDVAAVRSLDGVGIGLSMASTLVNLHQGMISLDRLPEGGSLFTVTVPITPFSSTTQSIDNLRTSNDIELF